MENPELTEIFEQFRFEVIEWRATRSGHCWTARQKAYQSALDKMGVQWLEKTQAYFKSRLDEIESSIKKHNCPCGFSCDDDTYFQVHVTREHQVLELEIPQGAPEESSNARESITTAVQDIRNLRVALADSRLETMQARADKEVALMDLCNEILSVFVEFGFATPEKGYASPGLLLSDLRTILKAKI